MTQPFIPNVPLIQQPLNVPSKPSEQTILTGGQAKRRYQDTFFDVHKHPRRFPAGRPWTAPRELAAMPEERQPDVFVGGDLQQGEYVTDEFGVNDRAATFASTWHAPWVPMKKYFRFVYDKKLIRFDYRAMFTHEKQYLDLYYQAAAKLGVGMNIRVKPGEMPDWQITQELGPPSRMVYVAQAAMANDPWLLGFIDEPNPTLAEILGYSNDGLTLAPFVPQVAPSVTVQDVLSTPQNELMAMVEQLRAQVESLTTAKAKRVANGKAGAAKRHGKATPVEAPV